MHLNIIYLIHQFFILKLWKSGLNEWFNDSLINTSLVSLLDESVFLNESLEWMIQWQKKFFTFTCCHLVAKKCNQQKRYLKRQLLSKDKLYYKLWSQYFCDNMNDYKTEIIQCSWDCFLSKHGKCLLSVSVVAQTQIWMFQYDFFQRFNRHD